VSRIRTLQTGRARTAALAAAIRAAAGSTCRQTVCTVRIAPGGVTAYDWRPDLLTLPADAAAAITELMHTVRPDIDWSEAHDYHLTTGMLRRSPQAGERGYAPEIEGTFGGTDAAFLPRTADENRRAA
jgi:hypothetical protein